MDAHRLVALVAGSAVVFAAGVAVANGRATQAGLRPRVVLRKPLPSVVRIGERLTVAGRVRGPWPGGSVVLESAPRTRWRVVASTSLRRGGEFGLHWRVGRTTPIGPLKIRLVVVRHGRLLVATSPRQSFVGSAFVYCRPAVPPAVNIPAGDGWIVGGVYGQGGPYPGVFQCASEPYTVTVTNASGLIVASQTVAALHSYTLVVPAGRYLLTSGGCHGSATVTAARQTKADTYCDYP